MTDSPDTGGYKPKKEEVIIEGGAVKIRREADVLDKEGNVVGKTDYTTPATRDGGEGNNPNEN